MANDWNKSILTGREVRAKRDIILDALTGATDIDKLKVLDACGLMPKPVIPESQKAHGGYETGDWMRLAVERAEAGDTAAIRMLRDEDEKSKAASWASDLVINVVPYTIPDRELPAIMKGADTAIVLECLAGLQQRLEQEAAPKELQDGGSSFFEGYKKWGFAQEARIMSRGGDE